MSTLSLFIWKAPSWAVGPQLKDMAGGLGCSVPAPRGSRDLSLGAKGGARPVQRAEKLVPAGWGDPAKPRSPGKARGHSPAPEPLTISRSCPLGCLCPQAVLNVAPFPRLALLPWPALEEPGSGPSFGTPVTQRFSLGTGKGGLAQEGALLEGKEGEKGAQRVLGPQGQASLAQPG